MADVQKNKALKIAILLYSGFTALDAIGPYEVLHILPDVDVVFVAEEPGPVFADLGMLSINASASYADVPYPDILVVPGGPGCRLLFDNRNLLEWIVKAHEKTLFTTSVCTGSLILAAAGLLKGLKATTHWNAYDTLEGFGAYPTPQRCVQEGSIVTSAGVSAGIDMALWLVAQITDEVTAKAVQLYIEYDPEPPYDTGSVSKAGPEVIARGKQFSSRAIAHARTHFKPVS